MRTLSTTLLAEQRKSAVTPYVRVGLLSADGLTSYTFTSADSPSRLYSVVHREEPYGGTCLIQLKNNDNYFNTRNLRGYRVRVGWGLLTSAGNEYSEPADLWVLFQRDRSEPGELLTELVCIDIWGLLGRTGVFTGGSELMGVVVKKVTADASGIGERISGATSLAKAIIYSVYSDRIHIVQPEGLSGTFSVGEIAESTSFKLKITAINAVGSGGVAPTYDGTFSVFTILGQMLAPFTTLVLDSDDPEANAATYKPVYQVTLGTDARAVIMDILDFTKCGLRMRQADMRMLYLDPAPLTADYEFDSVHRFEAESREAGVVVPNRVFVTNVVAGKVYVGSAEDAGSKAALGKWLTNIASIPSVGSDADATARAKALIARAGAEARAGSVEVPIMNCGQEVYDWLKITDARSASLVVQGRVGAVERRYMAGSYLMLARLGGLSTSADITAEGIPESNIQVEPEKPKDITPAKLDYWLLPLSIQGYQHDIVFTAVDQSRVDWTAGTIKFYNGTIMSANAGTHTLATAAVHYIYFVVDDPALKVTDDYLSVLTLKTGMLCLIQRGSDATVRATVIPSYGKTPLITADVIYLTGFLDKLPDGTYGKVLSTAISAGNIILSSVVQSVDYRTVTDTDKVTWNGKEIAVHRGTTAPTDTTKLWVDTSVTPNIWKRYDTVALAWVKCTPTQLDEIDDGTTYKRVLATDISAGHILLSSVVQEASYRTVSDGQVTTWDGKEIAVHRGTAAPADTTKLWLDTTTYIMKRYTGTVWEAFIGKWYEKKGVALDATKGIALYGGQISLKTYPTLTDYQNDTNVQCYVDTNGKIIAGGGNVGLDASGITINNPLADTIKRLSFKYDGVFKGGIFGTSSGITAQGELNALVTLAAVSSVTGLTYALQIDPATGTLDLYGGLDAQTATINTLHSIYPYDATALLGSATSRWERVYGVPMLDRTGVLAEGSFKHLTLATGHVSTYSDGAWRDNA